MSRTAGYPRVVFLVLFFLVIVSGCLNPALSAEAINLSIQEKEVEPDALGECTYRALMTLTSKATGTIPSLTLYVQVYDPEVQRGVAATTLSVKELKPGEILELTASLRAHCRSHYTLRAFVQY